MSPQRAVAALILALSRLSERERFAFVCHELHGWTYAQIGARFDCSHERARQYHAAAVRKLQEHLAPLREQLEEGLAA